MFGSVDDLYSRYAHRLVLTGNPKAAARDVGVPEDTINEFLNIAQTHPEVTKIVAEEENFTPDFENKAQTKKYILRQLMKEAHFRGVGSQQTARIAALRAIADLTGIEPPKKIDVKAYANGGMLLVPVMDAAAWEVSAEQSQEELKRRARSND